jgi:hypothetical protein
MPWSSWLCPFAHHPSGVQSEFRCAGAGGLHVSCLTLLGLITLHVRRLQLRLLPARGGASRSHPCNRPQQCAFSCDEYGRYLEATP